MPEKVYTSCCSLNQMVANNADSLRDLRRFVEAAKEESKEDLSMYRQGGAKTLFCMTVHPWEAPLEENLKKLGFKMVQDNLSRRNGARYKGGHIRMWLLNW